MSTARFEGSSPFLLHHGSVENSIYGGSALSEKDFDPDVLLESPIPITPPTPRRRGFSSRLIGWPAIVILGQLLLQLMGWGFFIVVKVRGQMPLPHGPAQWVKNNPHLVTLLATLIGTVLGACSSFLFSYAIRRSMPLYLNRPVSLAALGASVSISMRSVVFHRRSWKWPSVSVFFFLLAGIQTSGWTTLLTPVALVVSTPLVGSEIDLSSSMLRDMVNTSELDYCLSQSASSPLFAGQTESGYAAARATLGQISTFTLMDQMFNVSTGGVLPAYLTSFNASAWFTNTSVIPVTTHDVSTRRPVNGFATNYSMIQQGFTADISCRFQNLTNTTTPSLSIQHDWVNKWHNHEAFKEQKTIHLTSLSLSCSNSQNFNWSDVYTDDNKNWFALLACGPTDNYTVIIVTGGQYDWIPKTVCSVVPKITTVQVDYAPGINVRVVPNATAILDPQGPAGNAALSTLGWMLDFSQALHNNLVGDQLTAMRADSQRDTEDILVPIAEYIRGVMEFSGSVFRACLSSNTTFMEGMPSNMMIPTNGTFHTETLGWAYASGTTRWVLVPGTLIAFATIVVVIGAFYHHVGDIPKESHQFDPSDPLHLVAAAAAGGLNNTFTGLGPRDMKEGEKLDVVLGSIPGRGPALVRADQYRPVFQDSFSAQSSTFDDRAG
ncbi:hypothetical protein FB451DRAFT_1482730 [Mycena latifolia]|nr:hypothetical protein FB451DRAFT_1482730 [Mycena latifolia]